jgi:cytochrome c oxidase subunit 2
VIHAWWVPALAVKRDAIPGFINETWTKATKTGVYRGQCAELCGKDHGYMPIVVRVVEDDEFQSWLGEKRNQAAEIKELMSKNFTLDEQMVAGKTVYDKSCAACHGINGEGGVGNAIAGSAIATGDLAGHLNVGVNGVPGTAMQAFGGQINDVEMAAVITYQRNAFGNNMGDILQPIDVYNFKQGN